MLINTDIYCRYDKIKVRILNKFMVYRFFADIILITHLCYILFVVFGGLLLFKRRWLWKLHLPAVIWGFSVQYFVWICPLTNIENRLRSLGGEAGYENGFIDHFVTSLIYQDIAPEIHIFIAAALLLSNLSIYFYVYLYAEN